MDSIQIDGVPWLSRKNTIEANNRALEALLLFLSPELKLRLFATEVDVLN